MSNMSRNNSSTTLVGFSVHQPALGAALQFIPAMGTKQLDEMIDAYVPGNKPIQDKRAAVSMEFYQHVCQTGDMFKFFTVYPSLGSTTESPASSMLDSGYASSNFTSPIMSESQWTQASGSSFSSTGSHARHSSHQKPTSTDFSHLPGMKIMTRDGKDVTNSASRGCKTKEQRDHAHLMRVLKACEACKKKKVRCDPSHKRTAGSSGTRTAKKAKKAATTAAPPAITTPQPTSESLDQYMFNPINPISSFSFDTTMPESLFDPTMEWDQFIQYNEEPNNMVPVDYDFLYDPAGFFSPTSSNSLFSSQPITPAQAVGAESVSAAGVDAGVSAGTAGAEAQVPLPPYLNPGGEAGNDYADFNLYSPGSSTGGLDDDPALIKDLAAPSRPDYNEYLSHQRLHDGGRYETFAGHGRSLAADAPLNDSRNADGMASLFNQEESFSLAALDSSEYYGGIIHRPSSRVPNGTSRSNPSYPRNSPTTSATNLDTANNSSVASPNPDFRSRFQPFTTSKSRISDKSTKPQSMILESGLARNAHQTPSQSETTLLAVPAKKVRTTAGRRSTPASVAGLSVSAAERLVLATGGSGLTQRSVAAANVSRAGNSVNALVSGHTVRLARTDDVVNASGSGRSVGSNALSALLSRFNQRVTSAGALSAGTAARTATTALSMAAVCLLGLVLGLAFASLCNVMLSKAASEAANAIPALPASLVAAVASTAIFSRPLSFLRRLPMATVDDMKSANLGLFQQIRSVRSNVRKEESSRPSNGGKGTMSRLSHTARPILI
ncbi:hypothetical protein F4821DRAFT_231811 [Hypoxylon rubiginosum]|uniref:Uncharacterized protein n=1 Tax=Hypoxylon rubiginosum TaxID=110542 RepID=A0ACC0D9D9_9PEZI|nr:hypothetical protein F4821DRAFT_231811 [Hypoxylon rubiginosum]